MLQKSGGTVHAPVNTEYPMTFDQIRWFFQVFFSGISGQQRKMSQLGSRQQF